MVHPRTQATCRRHNRPISVHKLRKVPTQCSWVEQRLVRESVADFARSTLAPRVREIERARGVPDEVRRLLADAPGLRIVDDVESNTFPMPIDASGQDAILVGRIRQDVSDPEGHSIALFVAGDQLLKGAALNAVQIAERLIALPGDPT